MKTTLTTLLAMGILSFFGLTASADQLKAGDKAPDAAAPNQDGEVVQLADLYKEGLTLVFFYPKANTPGCTRQVCSLRDAYEKLTAKGLQVVGVSHDSVEDQKKFADDHNVPYSLLADTEKEVSRAFGVPRLGNLASRQAYLIKDGEIIWADHSASTDEQADDVLAILETLD